MNCQLGGLLNWICLQAQLGSIFSDSESELQYGTSGLTKKVEVVEWLRGPASEVILGVRFPLRPG